MYIAGNGELYDDEEVFEYSYNYKKDIDDEYKLSNLDEVIISWDLRINV